MKKSTLAILGIVVVVVAVVLNASLFTVHQTEQALVLQFGSPQRVETEPGLKFKMPFIQNVVRYDSRVLDLDRDLRTLSINEVMTPGGKSIPADALAAEAVARMEQHKVMALLVLDAQRHLTGIVHMHELLRAGVV